MGTQNILQGWTNLSTVPNTAKPQSLRMEHEGLSSLASEEVRTIVHADNLRNRCENKHSGNLLKRVLANDERQTVILHK